jgi:hypothetical protein
VGASHVTLDEVISGGMSRGTARFRRMCSSAVLVAGMAFGRARTARAEGGMAAYAVPAQCPGQAAWLEGVRARLPTLLRTHPLLESLAVHVDAGAGGYLGSIRSSSALELGVARTVRGATCRDVLDALGFIAVLGLERAASERQSKDDAEALAPSVPPVPELVSPSHWDFVDASAGASREAAKQNLQLGVAGFALLQSGLTPGSPLGLGLAVQLDWSRPDGGGASWQPLLLAGAFFTEPELLRVDRGALRLEHWSTHSVFCPWRFGASEMAALRPCADFDAGRSSGEGVGVIDGIKRAAPWLSASAELRGELRFGHSVELGVSLEGVAPLWRAHFYLLPNLMRFETPAFGLRAGSSLSVLF